MRLSCFKAYDVRGKVGEELNEELAWRIGRAYGQIFSPQMVAVGGDARLSSEPLKHALAEGLAASGADVADLGLVGTEEIYHAVFSQKMDGGLMVTGSHNPISDNGIKFVREDSKPVSGDNGLLEIMNLVVQNPWNKGHSPVGNIAKTSFKKGYIEHLMGYIDQASLAPMTIVTNAGNGAAGPVMDLLEERLRHIPIKFIKINHQPDGTFPNGIPNPLLPGNRGQTAEAVRGHGADIGLAWDGDFDRCFFFDETGDFVEGYYMVGLLAESLLASHRGGIIIHDPRLVWNTVDLVQKAGGQAVQSKTGHAFIKDRMRQEKAIYGGEMSAHHYFANFAYCDSGMIPWLLVVELMSRKKQTLSALVTERQQLFPCSGEINYTVSDAGGVLKRVEQHFSRSALQVDHIDGLSMEFPDWRFNLRASNTEPLLRLNVETRADPKAIPKLVKTIESLF